MKTPPLEKLNLFSKPLPFEHVVLADDVLDELHSLTASWAEKRIPIDPLQQQTVIAYVKHCSPKGASAREATLPTLFLAWFFLINDIDNGPERADLMGRLTRLITPNAPPPAADDIFETATAAFVDAVLETYPRRRLKRFFGFTAELIEATQRESLISELPLSRTYISIREHTAAVLPYTELFRLALEDGTPERENSLRMKTVEKHAVAGIYWVNDLLSLERDLRKNKLNMVKIVASERSISLEEATTRVERAARETFSALAASLNDLLQADPSPNRRRYAAFLASMQEGNRAATLELRERYFGNG